MEEKSPLKFAGINILGTTPESGNKKKIFGTQPKLPLNSLPQLGDS
jgi:hypothetical protein